MTLRRVYVFFVMEVSTRRVHVHPGQTQKDPSLRFNEAGRELLRWLDAKSADPATWERLVEPLPAHCSHLLVEFAQSLADSWLAAASHLRSLLDETEDRSPVTERASVS